MRLSFDSRQCAPTLCRSLQPQLSLLLVSIFIALLLVTGVSSAQAFPNCTYYLQNPDKFLGFGSSSFIQGTVNWYTGSHCATAGGTVTVPADGWAYATSEEAAIAVCDRALGGTNEVIRQANFDTFNYNIWQCHNTPGENSEASSARSGSQSRKRSRYVRKPLPPTGARLNQTDLVLSAVDGFWSGIEFQRVDASGVGIQWVLDLGFLDAVDVWSNIGSGYEVCFPQIGRIVFLDAATSPRTVVIKVDYEHRDGYTCAKLQRAGTLVLVQASDDDLPPGLSDGVVALADCQVTTLFNINLRDAPSGQWIGVVPQATNVTATARTSTWFYTRYRGAFGWLSAAFVQTRGNCAHSLFL